MRNAMLHDATSRFTFVLSVPTAARSAPRLAFRRTGWVVISVMPSTVRLPLLTALLLLSAAAPAIAPAQAAEPVADSARTTTPSAPGWVRTVVTGEDVVRTARRYLGVRYVLGGSTPRAFDCSGFVRWVFAQHGIELPRTAHEQAAVGDAPEPGDLRPGDLLFFWGGHGAQHIAMYVGGDTIIHASSRSRRVRLDRFSGSRLSPGWFGQRIIAVRRVLPLESYVPAPSTVAAAGPAR